MIVNLEPPEVVVSKRDRLVVLLDAYPLMFAQLGVGEATGGGEGVPSLPALTDHPSVRELVRCLGVLEAKAPTHYRHLKAFYGAEKRQVKAKLRVRGPQGRLVTVDGWQMERVTPRWVRQQRVRLGVSFLVGAFRGDVYVPDEMLSKAAA